MFSQLILFWHYFEHRRIRYCQNQTIQPKDTIFPQRIFLNDISSWEKSYQTKIKIVTIIYSPGAILEQKKNQSVSYSVCYYKVSAINMDEIFFVKADARFDTKICFRGRVLPNFCVFFANKLRTSYKSLSVIKGTIFLLLKFWCYFRTM